MHVCLKTGRKVYGCDHYNCQRAAANDSSYKGMNWCYRHKKRVYSCNHYECKQGGVR